MHNKFFLFSQTSGSKNVVMTGSAKDNDYYDSPHGKPAKHDNLKSYFFPRSEKKDDPLANTLDAVNCKALSRIRLGTWSFSRGALADRIAKRFKEGCGVDIVANQVYGYACKTLTKAKVPIHTFSDKGDYRHRHGIHEKNLMIDGGYAGSAGKFVFTGSHNWNKPSLVSRDENLLRIKDANIHDAFIDNFDRVKTRAKVAINKPSDCSKILPPKTPTTVDEE